MTEIQAIDVHAHYGNPIRPQAQFLCRLMSGDAGCVVRRARKNNIQLTAVSPLRGLMPRGRGKSDVLGGNEEAVRTVSETEGLVQWVVVDPTRPETFEQAKEILALPQCAGIKIHPVEHCYPIREYGAVIFEFAAKHGAVILTHSGEQNSLPADFVPFANEFPTVQLILAHIGCSENSDPTLQVRAIQQAAHGNVYADTSSSMSMIPNLIEWAVQEAGADRILFGTDSPLYFTGMQRARIDQAGICDDDKRKILYENAARLLDLRIGGIRS